MIGGLELNEDTVEVFVDGKPVKMTPIEFKILALLIRTPGRVYSADEIYERVWNEKGDQYRYDYGACEKYPGQD